MSSQTSVVKHCRSNKAYQKELFVYQSDFTHKAVLNEVIKPRTLVLSKLNGIPYLDIEAFSSGMVKKLAKIIAEFHSIITLEGKVLCHWDNQPRNILWDSAKQRFWLLDFEDIRLAYPEADIAHLFLFWAEVMPADEFKCFVSDFICQYQKYRQLNAERWVLECRKAKNRFDARRRRYCKSLKSDRSLRNINRRYLISERFLSELS